MLDIFFTELECHLDNPGRRVPSGQYLQALNDLLRKAETEGSNITRWHDALSMLRQAVLPYLAGSLLAFAEDLFQQARVLVGQIAVRVEVHRAWHFARRTEILREIESELLIAFEIDELLDILARGLSRLEIRDFYLVIYEDRFEPIGRARLILAVQNGRRVPIDPDRQVFPVRSLLPEGWLAPGALHSLVIEALHLSETQIGYIIFDAAPPPDVAGCDVYQALRIQLSSALKGIGLRQRLQDARRQAEEADQLKSRFLSMVSHELRTPLNLIVGLSEMAMRQRASETDSYEIQQKFLEQIYVSGQHLDRLIRDVLDLASSQVGQMSLFLKPLDLGPVLRDAACMGDQLARQKNLGFRVEIPDQLPLVNGDKTRLRQILLNLLSNAVKFTAHGEVALIVSLSSNEITISVQDTGLGIPREDQEAIFDEFHKSNRSVTRGYGGIGLGLAITRRLVEMHGGRIWVESAGAEGSGSAFYLTLPSLNPDALPVSIQEQPLPVSSRQGKVLILTRAPGGSQELSGHLARQGFQVEEVALQQTPDVVENLLAAPPGAVVLDLEPASELGWEMMRRIKENPATQDIPVLFFSLIQEKNAGAVLEMDYLTKPVGAEELMNALKRHGLLNLSRSDRRTVLIIDDEPGILDLHAQLVRTELPDCRVMLARDGLEGLKIMHERVPDLVLLDLMMPELDGFGVIKVMQSEAALRAVPVIVMSGQQLTGREMAWLNQGVAAVLGKGMFTTEEILARIEGVLSRNKRLGSEPQRLVKQALGFIHEHYSEPISRGDVAKHLCVNEQYLSRCFNKEIGIGPMVYLSRYRMQRAKRLLESSNLSITQVAMEVGMSSQSYFSRVFQEETGVTPSAYQRGARVAEK